MPSRIALVLGLCSLLASCAGGVAVPAYVAGPYADAPPWELYARLVEASREAGYEPIETDLDQGAFSVSAHSSEETVIRAQCYRGGWVRVVPAGPSLRPEGDRVRVPHALRRELVDYLDLLRRAAEAGS